MESINLKKLKEIELFAGYFARLIHSQNMTIAYLRIIAGSEAPEHSHPHEQICRVLEGDFELVIEGKKYRMDQNTVIIIPSNMKHSAKAITDCKVIDTFYPVRGDYRK
jgi:quercetin dioxygenase-like cupin family protein